MWEQDLTQTLRAILRWRGPVPTALSAPRTASASHSSCKITDPYDSHEYDVNGGTLDQVKLTVVFRGGGFGRLNLLYVHDRCVRDSPMLRTNFAVMLLKTISGRARRSLRKSGLHSAIRSASSTRAACVLQVQVHNLAERRELFAQPEPPHRQSGPVSRQQMQW